MNITDAEYGKFEEAPTNQKSTIRTSITKFDSSISTEDKLNTANYIVDEHGVQAQVLGDNIFHGAIVAIPPEHHEIHCGDSYVLTRIADLANGASDNILIIVPDEPGEGQVQKKYHLVPMGSSESEAIWYLYEAPVTTANGTSITFYNRERNSDLVTGLTAFHTPTITSEGTLLMIKHQGSGRGVGSDTRTEEFVLKNNTKYLLRVTNQTANANYVSWELNHYIHPGI